MPIQINGKRKSQISIPLNTTNFDIEKMVLSDEVVSRAIDGLVVKKIIIVPSRIINIVAS
jgi:leucyl-tRNA synthetase